MKLLHLHYRVLLIAAIIASMVGSSVIHSRPASAADNLTRPIPGVDQYLLLERESGCGVISKEGKILIEPKYRTINYVGDGLFATLSRLDAEKEDERLLIDAGGKVVTSLPGWADTSNSKFKEGILHLGDVVKHELYLNKKGEYIVEDGRFQFGNDFSCGLASVEFSDRAGRASVYINKRGKIAIGPFRDAECWPFWKGKAVIKLPSKSGGEKCGLISTKGKFVVPLIYDSICTINDGQLAEKIPSTNYFRFYPGFILIKYPPQIVGITIPREIRADTLFPCQMVNSGAPVASRSALWGYVDLSGKIVIPAKFVSCGEFSGNFAPASMLDQENMLIEGRIDRQGQWISPTETDSQDRQEEKASNREYLFARLLKSQDLIGMPVSELEKAIGNGSIHDGELLPDGCRRVLSYALRPNADFGYALRVLDIALDENQKVIGWCIHGRQEQRSWITENVVFINPDYFCPGNLIPRAQSNLVEELK